MRFDDEIHSRSNLDDRMLAVHKMTQRLRCIVNAQWPLTFFMILNDLISAIYLTEREMRLDHSFSKSD